jgi:hypothetical protein
LEKEYQDTLNEGFRNVYLTSGIASVIALFLLVFYSRKRENMIKRAGIKKLSFYEAPYMDKTIEGVFTV